MRSLCLISSRKNPFFSFYLIPCIISVAIIYLAVVYVVDFAYVREQSVVIIRFEHTTTSSAQAKEVEEKRMGKKAIPTLAIQGNKGKLFDDEDVTFLRLGSIERHSSSSQEGPRGGKNSTNPDGGDVTLIHLHEHEEKRIITLGKDAKLFDEGDVTFLHLRTVDYISAQDKGDRKQHQDEPSSIQEKEIAVPFAVGKTDEKCDVFSGRWVYDRKSRPHYTEQGCGLINPQFTCQAHGRRDTMYQHWRWQPNGCSLPSFNATFMLERLRGRRILYVGDSLGGGMHNSMLCLLQSAYRSQQNPGNVETFKTKKFHTVVKFHWSPFLVESNCDNPSVHRVPAPDRVIHLNEGSLNTHAQHWKGYDILIFDTYTWWLTGFKRVKTLQGRGNMTYVKDMEMSKAYRVVLKRMVDWVEKNMDPRKTRVFFTTMSPTHWKSADWRGERDGNCYNQVLPISNPNYWGSGTSKAIMRVVEEIIGSSKYPFTVLNITQLSDYRKDAHTTIYKHQKYNLSPEQLKNPRSYTDCVHWCLPGLQDTWNELFYNKLFFP
ncbi:protein trichome birefringence-like 33 [Typha angustifolia]|uniref:protein trichome birefringence-like 33 n=1 Tax=Typha angustifolia TaxID=59011 RepID=UPI003C305312